MNRIPACWWRTMERAKRAMRRAALCPGYPQRIAWAQDWLNIGNEARDLLGLRLPPGGIHEK